MRKWTPREDDLLKLHRHAGTELVCSPVRQSPELTQCSCSLQLLNHSDEPWAACFSPSAQLPAGFLGFNNQLGRSCYVLVPLFTIVTLQKTIPKIISHPDFGSGAQNPVCLICLWITDVSKAHAAQWTIYKTNFKMLHIYNYIQSLHLAQYLFIVV